MQGRQAASATRAVSACWTTRPRSCPLPSPRSCPCGTAAQLLDRRYSDRSYAVKGTASLHHGGERLPPIVEKLVHDVQFRGSMGQTDVSICRD